MFGEQRTRALLGPADPARAATVAPPRVPARDLIGRAGAGAPPVGRRRRLRPSRRLVLTAAAAAVAAGAAALVRAAGVPTVDEPGAGGPPGTKATGAVLVPVAYQYDVDAQSAGAQLRRLAGGLVDARYERRTGRYAYHHLKVWGDPVMRYGPYILGYVHDEQVWQAADGTGRQSTRQLQPQYPDRQSRDYWQHHLKTGPTGGTPAPDTYPLPPRAIPPLPADRTGLVELLKIRYGGNAVCKAVATVYLRYAVPRGTRAEILRALADVPGFLWRGEVRDRAGRTGVAVTFDDRGQGQQHLLIFDPKTGELLASELLALSPVRISTYLIILGTDRTDRLG